MQEGNQRGSYRLKPGDKRALDRELGRLLVQARSPPCTVNSIGTWLNSGWNVGLLDSWLSQTLSFLGAGLSKFLHEIDWRLNSLHFFVKYENMNLYCGPYAEFSTFRRKGKNILDKSVERMSKLQPSVWAVEPALLGVVLSRYATNWRLV